MSINKKKNLIIVNLTSCDGIKNFYNSIDKAYKENLKENEIVVLDLMNLSKLDSETLKCLSGITLDLQTHKKKVEIRVPDRFLTAVTLEGLGEFIGGVIDIPKESVPQRLKTEKRKKTPIPKEKETKPLTFLENEPPPQTEEDLPVAEVIETPPSRFRKYLWLFGLMLILVPGIGVGGFFFVQNYRANLYFRLGTNQESSVSQRIYYLEKAISIKDSTSSQLALGKNYLEAGKGEDAYEVFSKLMAEDKKNYEALEGVAQAAFGLGREEEALKKYKEFLELNPPATAYAYFNMGQIVYKQNEFALASSYFEKSLDKLSLGDQLKVYQLLTTIYEDKLKDVNKAIYTYEKLITLFPDQKTYRYKILVLYQSKGDQRRVIYHLKWLILNDPFQAPKLFPELIKTFETLNQKEDAISECENLISAYKDKDKGFTVTIMEELTHLYLEKGDYDSALKLYKEMLEMAPTYIPAYIGELRLLHRKREVEERFKVAKLLTQKTSTNLEGYIHLVESALQMGELEKAQEVVSTVLNSKWQALLNAKIFIHMKKYEDAIISCDKASGEKTISEYTTTQLAKAYILSGAYNKAFKILSNTILEKENIEGNYIMSQLLIRLGFIERAKTYLKKCEKKLDEFYGLQANRILIYLEKGLGSALPSSMEKVYELLSDPRFKEKPMLLRKTENLGIQIALVTITSPKDQLLNRLLLFVKQAHSILRSEPQGVSLPGPEDHVVLGGYAFPPSLFESYLEEEVDLLSRELSLWRDFVISNVSSEDKEKVEKTFTYYEKRFRDSQSISERLDNITEGITEIISLLLLESEKKEIIAYWKHLTLTNTHLYQKAAINEATAGRLLFKYINQHVQGWYLYRKDLNDVMDEYQKSWEQAKSFWDQRQSAIHLKYKLLLILTSLQETMPWQD